jgi:HSP20 family protein
MSPQAATAMQSTKGNVPVKQAASEEISERIRKTYDSIARRAFEIFEADGRWFGREWEHWFRAESEILCPIHLEISDFDDHLTLRADAPGFSSDEVTVIAESRKVTIVGKHEAKEEIKKGHTTYTEHCANEILRVIDLPAEVDGSQVTAVLKDGVLRIELPKASRAKPVWTGTRAA